MNTTHVAGQEILSLAIDDVFPDLSQPRKSLLKEELERMRASVAARGVIQPIRVRWDKQRDSWVIVSGETRWRAARLAGLERVPCLPVEGELSETDILEEQITENVVRNQLHPLEQARALAKLKALKQCTSQQLASELGFSAAGVCRSEALLSLPEDIQALVDSGALPESAAYEVSKLGDVAAQRELAHGIAAKTVTRDQAAAIVRASNGKTKPPKRERLSCKVEGGVSVTVSAVKELTPEILLSVIRQLQQEAKRLQDAKKQPGGGVAAALP